MNRPGRNNALTSIPLPSLIYAKPYGGNIMAMHTRKIYFDVAGVRLTFFFNSGSKVSSTLAITTMIPEHGF